MRLTIFVQAEVQEDEESVQLIERVKNIFSSSELDNIKISASSSKSFNVIQNAEGLGITTPAE
jgi:hypothetical protein